MAKKKLLSEAQVRRFMSLANIKPLNEMGSHSYGRDDEESKLMEEDAMEEEEPMDEPAEMSGDMDMPDMEDDEDEDLGDAEVSMDEELVDELVQAAATIQQVADLLGGGGAGEMDDMPELDDDMPEMDDDMPEMDDEEDEMKELEEVQLELSEEEIVNEVARRVAKRIVEAKRAQQKMNEALGRKPRRSKKSK